MPGGNRGQKKEKAIVVAAAAQNAVLGVAV